LLQDACSIVEAKDCALVIGVTYFLSALLRSFYDDNANDDDDMLLMTHLISHMISLAAVCDNTQNLNETESKTFSETKFF